METKYSIIGIIILGMLVLSLGYAYYQSQRIYVLKQKIVLGDIKPGYASFKPIVKYHIEVYRNNKLIAVREKTGDPISIQWYRFLAATFLGLWKINKISWYDFDYQAHSLVDLEMAKTWAVSCYYTCTYDYESANPVMYIGLGDSNITPSVYDYEFSVVISDKPKITVENDEVNSRFVLLFTKTFTIDKDFTLKEVGLFLTVDTDLSAYGNHISWKKLLVAHDIISPEIVLYVEDVVTVTYTILIPYNTNGPFTKWFYHALINYALGYKGTMGSSLEIRDESNNVYALDTAADTDPYPDGEDMVQGDYVLFEIGSGVWTGSKWEAYNLTSRLQRIPITDPEVLTLVGENETFTVKYVVSFSFTQPATIYEIGVSYFTDGQANMGYAGKYFLWLYWVLPSAIQVDSGDGMRLEITIEIPYA